ncbi:two-component regulator propeller domain-containing protein [Melioribacteraceae bacterium 4301-Me]|uniref:ligand-binding sensor domain-containing protein n=1 Tax=Pyranulibacter aquaticus TaxID=3163344 RepID=UPI003596F6A4
MMNKIGFKLLYKMGVIFYLIFSLLLLTDIVFAQSNNFTFERITREQGLIPGNVNDIVQDSIGFIWMATENGLCRYDGYNFLYFRNEPTDTASLSFNNVFSLLKDKNGIIWVGTLGGGLNKFDSKTRKFKRFRYNPNNPNSISSDIIYKLYRDSKNRIWISTLGGGLNLFNPVTETFVRFQHNPHDSNSISSNMASAIYEDKYHNFWVGTFDAGMNLFYPDEKKFIHFKNDSSNIYSINHNQIMQFLEDDKGRFWVATFGGGVNLFDRKTKKFYNIKNKKNFTIKPDHLNVRTLYEDENYLWVGTYNGLFLFDKNNFAKIDIYYNPNNPQTINNNNIRSIFRDRTGVFWVGTITGVNKYDSMKKRFHLISFKEAYKHKMNNLRSLPSKFIFENILWASLEKPSNIDRKNRRIYYWSSSDFTNKINMTISRSSYFDEKGNLWVGSYDGIHYYDRFINEFVNVQYSDDGTPTLGNNFVKCFYVDKQGNFWAGTMAGGLSYYNYKKNIFKKYLHYENKPETISDSRVMSILEDSKGLLWVGTFGGLDIFNKSNETFKHYQSIPNDKTTISNDRIYCIYESKNGDLWIGTYQGLNKYNREQDNFERFPANQSLGEDTIYGILEDDYGNLWIRTNQGITKFNPSKKEVYDYTSEDGLAGLELNGNIYFKDATGKMFFGFSNGLISFYPNEIVNNPFKPEIVFTKLSIMDHEVGIGEDSPLTRPLNEMKEIVLSYKDKVISFEFSALHYAIPYKNKYAYKLGGLFDDWTFVDAEHRYAKFTNLSPGKYVLRVKASNNDGLWGDNERTISIIIKPPFWETWWFRSIAVIAVLLIIFLFYENRLNRLLEIERTRTRIARNLHDEVGGSLSSIQYFVRAIKKNLSTEDNNAVSKYLNLIMESSDDAQEKIKDLIWTVNPEEDGLGKFLIKFNRYASDLLDSKGISYHIDLPSGVDNKSIPMEKRQHLWCICKETVTNIVKHSQCKTVDIKFTIQNNKLNFYIADDGVGFDMEQKHSSNGIVNIKNRAEQLKADYSLKTSHNKGTSWFFSIKI